MKDFLNSTKFISLPQLCLISAVKWLWHLYPAICSTMNFLNKSDSGIIGSKHSFDLPATIKKFLNALNYFRHSCAPVDLFSAPVSKKCIKDLENIQAYLWVSWLLQALNVQNIAKIPYVWARELLKMKLEALTSWLYGLIVIEKAKILVSKSLMCANLVTSYNHIFKMRINFW